MASAKYSLKLSEVVPYCLATLGVTLSLDDLRTLIESRLLPVLDRDGEPWVLLGDVHTLAPVLERITAGRGVDYVDATLFSRGTPASICIGPDTRLELPPRDVELTPEFYPAVRNLIATAAESTQASTSPHDIAYFLPTRIATGLDLIASRVAEQLERAKSISEAQGTEFANSAYYMGSKHLLAGFVVEALCRSLPAHGTVLDLMCGSGAVAGACSRFWPTLASDAQAFCCLLAQVQGGGFSRSEAVALLSQVLPRARENANLLAPAIHEHMEREDQLLHSSAGPELKEQYRAFLDSFPLFPANGTGTWCPRNLVEERRQDPKKVPYMLCATYFANVYLGLRQSVEVDCLRYAIDQLTSPLYRSWALGALIATVSRLSSTAFGHFAQPLNTDLQGFGIEQLAGMLEQRAYSITHEFGIRLMNLAEESERVRHPVRIIPGPWATALKAAEEVVGSEPLVVYLDPPYKREEYSRYYHLLETLVAYSYPSIVGKGRIPDKHKGERFDSEFFTRSQLKITRQLAATIEAVLARGWTCAWSYSDISDAWVLDVLDLVTRGRRCNVWSYACPHRHNAQGGRRPKKVTEYLVLVQPL
ncbi:MAG: hypothetical protein ABSC08_20170 [Bryobacteraceae bacterium]